MYVLNKERLDAGNTFRDLDLKLISQMLDNALALAKAVIFHLSSYQTFIKTSFQLGFICNDSEKKCL